MKNILEFIENSALKYPDKLAVADEEGGLTYGQMEKLSRQIGAWIYEKTDGVRNKPVAVLLDKKPGSVAAYMGVVYSGNFYVVLMRRCRRPEPSRYSNAESGCSRD